MEMRYIVTMQKTIYTHIYIGRILVLMLALFLPVDLVAQDEAKEVESKYLALIDSSYHYGEKSEYHEAARCLQQAMQSNPTHPLNVYLLNNLGGLQQLMGENDQALLSYSAALERSPDELTVRYNRAKLYERMGKLKAAITDFSLIIARMPRDEVYRYQRAMLYMLAKEYDLAELDLSAILDQSPESLKARIGYAMLETARERYDQAEQLYEHLVNRLPNSWEVYEGRARLYLARGMKGYAVRDINKAFDLAKPVPTSTLYRLRSAISYALGDDQAALRDERTALMMETGQSSKHGRK